MERRAIALGLAALAVAGCASLRSPSPDHDAPAAAVPDLSNLAGRWRGGLYETAGSLTTGSIPLDITLGPDGAWQGTVGRAPAAGRAWLDKGRLVLSGTVTGSGGRPEALHYTLSGDDQERWGQTVAPFSSGRASVSLERQPES